MSILCFITSLFKKVIIWNFCYDDTFDKISADLKKRQYFDHGIPQRLTDKLETFIKFYAGSNWNRFAIIYMTCEILLFCMATLQIHFMNKIANEEVLEMVFNFQNSYGNRDDFFKEIFPRFIRSKVDLPFEIPTVNNNIEAVCVIPMNIINEKAFVGIWFCLIVVTVASGIPILANLISLFCPKIRTPCALFVCFFRDIALQKSDHSKLYKIISKQTFGEWLIFLYITYNFHPDLYLEFIAKKYQEISVEN